MLPRALSTAGDFPPVDPARWRSLAEADLHGAPFDKKLVTRLYEGVELQPLYTREHWPYAGEPSGASGLMPMTRAARPLANHRDGWDIRQDRAEADPATLNAALREDLEGGVTSVTLRLDAAGRAGLDADDPRAAALVGLDGCAISSRDDLARALDGVYLQMITVGLEAGAAFLPAAALLADAWTRAGLTPAQARGCFNADPLAALARDGHLPMPLPEALAQLADLARFTHATYAHAAAVRVGTAAYHHAGATATQDLALSMATAAEYLRAMTAGGLSVADAARQIRFSYAVGTGFFLAIAKLRAARALWARVVDLCLSGRDASASARDGAQAPPDPRRMSMHVRPSKRVLATRDPWVNVLRSSAAVFAAAVAGADAIGSTPHDAPVGEPSELARRLARNTHHILMQECQLHRLVDPAGGSWYLERLTDELCEKAWSIFRDIESRGGLSACLLSGWVHEQIESAFAPRARNLATRRDAVLGVSEFPQIDEPRPAPANPRPDRAALLAMTRERLAAFRAQRQAAPAPGADAAGLTARAVAAAAGGATLGEIARLIARNQAPPAVLPAPIAVHPFAEPFERLRDAADRYEDECGTRPAIALITLGPPAAHLPRLNFARNLFEAGGFATRAIAGDDAQAAARQLADARLHLAVVCGSDEVYSQAVPGLAQRLHAGGARTVILAGNPGPHEAAYRAAGVDRFVFVKCDVVALLSHLLAEEGAAR